MNILAIDASSPNISLGILWKDKLIADFNRQMDFGASKLIQYIDAYVKRFSLSLNKFDCFVIGKGPGSFTGLRISFSIIKGFKLALGKPVIAIGSFFTVAYPFTPLHPESPGFQSGDEWNIKLEQTGKPRLKARGVTGFTKKYEKIAVISDARKGMIYATSFKIKDGVLCQETREHLASIKEFVHAKRDYFFVTYDMSLREEAKAIYPMINFYERCVYPKAKYLLELAIPMYNKGEFTPLERLEPLYVHPKTCQIK
jgi:tRNA threonylcarbamoyl adenosine modification protein YeaZ